MVASCSGVGTVGRMAQKALREGRGLSIEITDDLTQEARDWANERGIDDSKLNDREVVEQYIAG